VAKPETLELNVKERILFIMKEILTEWLNYFEFVVKCIIFDNEKLTNILNLKSIVYAALWGTCES
jgi:hypothetical protein